MKRKGSVWVGDGMIGLVVSCMVGLDVCSVISFFLVKNNRGHGMIAQETMVGKND